MLYRHTGLYQRPNSLHDKMPCYRKGDRAMRTIYKLFTLILFTLTATILCADFDFEGI